MAILNRILVTLINSPKCFTLFTNHHHKLSTPKQGHISLFIDKPPLNPPPVLIIFSSTLFVIILFKTQNRFCSSIDRERERLTETEEMFAAMAAEKRWFAAVAIAALIAGALLITSFVRSGDRSVVLCSLSASTSSTTTNDDHLLSTILHYATTPVTPQQSLAEIRITYDVLRSSSPSSAVNFLVFGLGHDSPMWSAFNHRGTTLFLEEDPKWYQIVLKNSPNLKAHPVKYPTKLVQANDLLKTYRSEPSCLPPKAHLKGNRRCRLALSDLPREVYEREWDLIMIDAPKGYYDEAPGRMGAIYSAAVMARGGDRTVRRTCSYTT
ncbi:Glucuronoxylan 4-O-methyltransferase 3 [Acorus calamus]|uniref:Glucuronoxylan 4-O-methyltransferase 3 n=1 Tax=Acorus calamus TaxID=4465 RepID=A0AAV9F4G0_ACOCL|nr:Glucuronoxylan 4-O-methyltransferase 3 [Acorus calamus]